MRAARLAIFVMAFACIAVGPRARAQADPDEDVSLDPLADELEALREEVALTRRLAVERQPAVVFHGYIDFGFFVPQGDGGGAVADLGPPALRAFPHFADRYAWVFLGDPLAPAVNTRGEPADRGQLPGPARFDPINSNGAPGFIANELNLRGSAALADSAIATFSVNFAPRSGGDFRSGDAFDVDIAQLEWMLGRARRTSIFVGKMESVVGVEYRQRKSDQRFGITPSLMARYTTGTPLGLKLRSKLGAEERLVVAGAVTNGSSVIEAFHFFDEIDSNAGKTLSGRVSYRVPVPFLLEIGLSGAWGPQDRAADSEHAAWLGGIDLQFEWRTLRIEGQWLRGSADGETPATAQQEPRVFGLRLNDGGYVLLEWVVGPRLGLWVRGGVRDALVWLGDPTAPEGAERLYVTRSWRASAGARFAVNQHIAVKVEYLRNGEFGAVPNIRNDVFTSSLVLAF